MLANHMVPVVDRGFHPGWWHFGGLVLMLLFLILVGVAVWALVRSTRQPPLAAAAPPALAGQPARQDPALEEVRLRYARGEIPRDEFVRRSRDLGAAVPDAEPEPPRTE